MITDPPDLDPTASTPTHSNPPGKDAIAYRYGTHTTVLQRLMSRLQQQEILTAESHGSTRPLQKLSLSDGNDPALALLDTWAVVADVLSFYQERIANEGYLRTATEDRSIVELSRTIGYELRPGVAATTYLVFTVDDSPGSEPSVVVPRSTRVQSIPTRPGEVPQTFETADDLLAQVEWNVLAPRLQQTFRSSSIEANGLKLQGTNTQLQPGDTILLLGEGRRAKPDDSDWAVRSLTTVEPNPQKGYTQIGWSNGLTQLPLKPKIFVFRQRAAIFGHNAPTSAPLMFAGEGKISVPPSSSADRISGPTPLVKVEGTNTFFRRQLTVGDSIIVGNHVRRVSAIADDSLLTVDLAFPEALREEMSFSIIRRASERTIPSPQGTQLDLDAVYARVLPQSWILLSQVDSRNSSQLKTQLCQVSNASAVFNAEAELTGKITRLVIDPRLTADEFNPRQTTVWLQSEQLELFQEAKTEPSFKTNGTTTLITLDRTIPHPKLGQCIILSGSKKQDPYSEVVTVENLLEDDDGYTSLTLQALLPTDDDSGYDPGTLKIYGNVVLATHGETVVDEVLGSGDGTQANQRFKLKKPPLTYVSTASSAGIQSTLLIYVNQVLWQQVTSLHNQDARSQCYVVQTDDQGQTEIIFGDGIQGARLPSGQENVRATYRSGIGQLGEVKAGSLILLQNRPLGIRDVTNPLPATGAADRDTAALTRKNAPRTVLTLNRVVSLRDFENFAQSFAGIGKAQATQLWTGDMRPIFITVTDADGEVALPALCDALQGAIAAAGNGLQPVRVKSFNPEESWFNLSARVLVDNRYRFETIEALIRQTLSRAFSFTARDFGQGVAASEVIQVIQSVEGVIAVDLNAFYLTSQPEPLQSFLNAEVARWSSEEKEAYPAQILLLKPEASEVHLEAWV